MFFIYLFSRFALADRMTYLLWMLFTVLALGGATTDAHAPGAGQSASVRQLMNGEQLFRSYCAACHGANGKGNGPVASALKTPPADLTLIAKRNGGKFPLDSVTRYVTNGDSSVPAHGSKDMPVWGPNFVALAPGSFKPINERIEAVISYIQSIQVEK
jgi:mono/diheme cytochrome c family protein